MFFISFKHRRIQKNWQAQLWNKSKLQHLKVMSFPKLDGLIPNFTLAITHALSFRIIAPRPSHHFLHRIGKGVENRKFTFRGFV